MALVVSAVLGFARNAAAQHADDIVIALQDGRIATFAADEAGGNPTASRVFQGSFADFSGTWFTSDPGFDSIAGALPGGSRVGLATTGPIRIWSGSSFVSPGGEQIRISFGPSHFDTGPGPAGGTLSAAVGGNGQYHAHWGFTLLGDGATPSGGDDDIYLLPLTLFHRDVSNQPTAIGNADEFFLLLGKNAGAPQFAAASLYANQVLVPEPGAMGAIGVFALAALCRRRRRSGRHSLPGGRGGSRSSERI